MAFFNLSNLSKGIAFHSLLRRRRSRGQSMVEVTLTLPFMIILIFGMIEMNRVWQSWHGAKLAADDGCYTAAVNRDAIRGQDVMETRANSAQITFTAATVSARMNDANTLPIGYECTITVLHRPLFTGLSISLPGTGDVSLFGAGIPITYSNDYFRSVF